MGGVSGAVFVGLVPGYVLPVFGYTPLFLTIGCFYLVGLYALHKLMGDLRPLEPVSV